MTLFTKILGEAQNLGCMGLCLGKTKDWSTHQDRLEIAEIPWHTVVVYTLPVPERISASDTARHFLAI